SHMIGPPLLRATIHDNRIYTAGVVGLKSDTKWTSGGGYLWHLRMDCTDKSEITALEYDFKYPIAPLRGYALLCWQIIDKRHYCLNYGWSGEGEYGVPKEGRNSHREKSILASAQRVHRPSCL